MLDTMTMSPLPRSTISGAMRSIAIIGPSASSVITSSITSTDVVPTRAAIVTPAFKTSTSGAPASLTEAMNFSTPSNDDKSATQVEHSTPNRAARSCDICSRSLDVRAASKRS